MPVESVLDPQGEAVELIVKNNTDYKTENFRIGKRINFTISSTDKKECKKAVKKLFGQEVIIRHQKNLQNGGYIFTYECNSKMQIRKKIKQIIQSWSTKVENKIDRWRG